jgi:hypothetical protein
MRRSYHPIETQELLEEFYETIIKEKYPELHRKEMDLIVMSCWKQVRSWLNEDRFPNVRLHYLGIFRVPENLAVKLRKRLKDGVDKKKVYYREGFYERRERSLDEFLKKKKSD